MHKTLRILSLLALSLGVFTLPVRADEDTPLAKVMGEMNTGMKGVGRALKSGDLAAAVAPCREAQKAMIKSFEFLPATFDKIPAAEKEAKAADYRMQLSQSLAKLYQLEIALLKGDKDAAGKIATELNDMKKKGHNDYKKDE